MADTHINIGGTWKAIDGAYVNIGGVWKTVQSIYVNIGGTWKKTWDNFVVNVDGTLSVPIVSNVTAVDPANALAGIRLLQNGSLQRHTIGGGWTLYSDNWGSPIGGTPGDSYWARVTIQSGDTFNNIDDGSGWLQLNATREWSHLQTVIGSRGPTVVKVEIASDSGGSTIVDTGYFTITATVEGTS